MTAGAVKIGLVGCGRIGTMYAKYLASLPEFEITLADTRPDQAIRLAEQLGPAAPVVTADVGRLLDTADAVIVTSSTASHDELVAQAIARRLPTLCEKPLTLDLAGTERLGTTADRLGVPLWVGFQRHFDPEFTALRRQVEAGEIGRIYTLRLFSHDASWPPLSRLAESGSIFHDLMLHDFDLVRWLSGGEVAEVAAVGDVLAVPGLKDLGDYDAVAVTLRLASGGVAVLTAGRHHPLGYDVRIEILGSRDSVTAGSNELTPQRHIGEPASDRPRYRDYQDRFAEAYRTQIDAFVAAARGADPDPRAGTWQDSYAALALADAAAHSARTRSLIRTGPLLGDPV